MTDSTDLLKWGRDKLKLSKIESYKIDALLILQNAACLSKEQIYFGNCKIDDNQIKIYKKNIAKRSESIPVAKIIGSKNFYNDNFIVNYDVLDPRPDSEILIEAFCSKYCDFNSKINVLEIGIGSGCLSLSLLKLYPNMNIYGVDISQKALNVAKKNIDKMLLQDRIKLLKSDIFSNIANNLKFDEIISNPPYIPSCEIAKLDRDIQYDPIIALDGGCDGLNFYKKIAEKSADYLSKKGGVLVEIGINQDETIIDIFKKNNFKILNSYKDLNNIIRILSFIKNHDNII